MTQCNIIIGKKVYLEHNLMFLNITGLLFYYFTVLSKDSIPKMPVKHEQQNFS